MLDWYIISSADYEAAKTASKLSDEYLYFLSDTHQIMRGATSFTDACELYTGAKPATPAGGFCILCHLEDLDHGYPSGSRYRIV